MIDRCIGRTANSDFGIVGSSPNLPNRLVGWTVHQLLHDRWRREAKPNISCSNLCDDKEMKRTLVKICSEGNVLRSGLSATDGGGGYNL